MNEVKTI